MPGCSCSPYPHQNTVGGAAGLPGRDHEPHGCGDMSLHGRTCGGSRNGEPVAPSSRAHGGRFGFGFGFGVWRLAFEQKNQPDFRRNNNPDTTIITIGGNAYAIR